MNLISLPAMLILFTLFTFSSLIFVYFGVKSKRKKLSFVLAGISFVCFIYIGCFCYVENQSNGARLNTNNTITLYSSYNDETYTEEIRLLGSTKIKYYDNDNSSSTANDLITIKRNIFTGTYIEAPSAARTYLNSLITNE